MSKFATVIILLMAMLNLIPPLFKGTVYFDNSYYCVLYSLLSYTCIVLPFLVPLMKPIVKSISFVLGCWFFAGLVFEFKNLFIPYSLENSKDSIDYYIYLVCFIIAVILLIINEENKINNEK